MDSILSLDVAGVFNNVSYIVTNSDKVIMYITGYKV